MEKRSRWIFRGMTVSVFALGAALGPASVGAGLHATRALALPAHVPTRCFSPVGTKHVLFGPEAGLADPPAPSPNTSFSDNFSPSVPTRLAVCRYTVAV